MASVTEARHCVVYVTCGKKDEAETIARAVVGENLAACVNIVPAVTSIYRWEGEIQHDSECLLIIKTVPKCLPTLEARVKALHSYTVAEFIALPVVAGSEAYLGWVSDNTRAD